LEDLKSRGSPRRIRCDKRRVRRRAPSEKSQVPKKPRIAEGAAVVNIGWRPAEDLERFCADEKNEAN